MKFSNGFWVTPKGYDVNFATQPYEVTTTENSITILATPAVIQNRGMTLAGPNLEITYSSTAEDIIKVGIVHYKGGLDNTPEFELNENQGYKPVINSTEEFVELISGNTKVVIKKGNSWDVQFYYKEKHLTGNSWRCASYIKEDKSHVEAAKVLNRDNEFFDYPGNESGTYIREQFKSDIGECIYGFGEKFTPFVKNGQVVEMWNSDGGTCTDQGYKNIPFYISSRSYGVLVNSSDRVSFEVMSDTVSRTTFTVPGEELEYFVIGGENLEEVIENYTGLTGKPALPPAYSFGLWLSTSFTTSYDEKTINSFIDGMTERDIPLQVFHFDCFWMKEYEWCNFEWDTRQFPNPKEMLSRLHNKGLEVCVWINSYVGQRSKLFAEGKQKGYFIKNTDGSVFQTDFWQPGMAIVDFTNPDACKWFKGLLKQLFEMGVNNIKTDFGERIPTDCKYYNGMDPVKMHNYYTYLYNKCVFEALEEFYGKDKACLFARSATVGGQKFPVHWGGDCYAEYSAMAETIRGGLSLCSTGFGFFSHDIGGFEATAPADVYKRWCAFGLMSTHSRLHGSSSYRVPWSFDEEASDVLRFYTKLKGKLMPYLWAQAIKTHTVGIPMMRSMIIAFSDDAACRYLDKQYMLGDNLLIAPVMSEDGVVEFYVPQGIWEDIVTKERYEGGRYYTRKCNYYEMPILARPNSIVSYGVFETNDFVYDYLQNSTVTIYNLEDGCTAKASVYDSEANKLTDITANREGNTVKVSYEPTNKSFTIAVSNTDKTVVAETGTNEVIIEL